MLQQATHQDYFIWNGVDSRTYGVYVSEQPPITIPQERSTQTTVPGRPGTLTTLEGTDVYDDLVLAAECFITDESRIHAIAGWLKGGGTITFANRIGGHYNARISNQIPFEKVLKGNPHRTFSINFRCYPFWYQDNVADITVTTSGTMVNNPGSVYAEPIITVYGSGDIMLMVGTTIMELMGISGSITLNSVIQEAYNGTTLMNDHCSGDFPILYPGGNGISWSGSVSRVVITPNWRYL